MKNYLVVHKASLFCQSIISGTPKALENDGFKLIEIPDNILTTAYTFLEGGKHYDLLNLVKKGTARKTHGHTRNTRSAKWREDRDAAVEAVLGGASYKWAASKFNVHPDTVKRSANRRKNESK